QANFIKNFKNTPNIDFEVRSVFDPPNEEYQICIAMGLLYHLKFPFLAIEKLAKVTTETMIIETEALSSPDDSNKMQFIEHTFRNDDSTWWIPGEECIKGFLRSSGFPYVKSFYFPQTPDNPFGFHYSAGKTVEGFPASQRIMIIARRFINSATESFFNELPNVEPKSAFPQVSLDILNSQGQNISQNKATIIQSEKVKYTDERVQQDEATNDQNFYWEEVNEYKRLKLHLEQKNTELISYIDILENERNSYNSAHQEVVNLLEKSRSDFENHSKEHLKTVEHMRNIETERDSWLNEYNKLADYLEVLKEENQLLLAEHDKFTKTIERLKLENECSQQAIDELEAHKTSLEFEQTSWETAHEQLETYVEVLKEENSLLLSEHTKFTETIKKYSLENDSNQEALTSLKKHVNDLESERNNWSSAHDQLESYLEVLKEENTDILTEHNKLENYLEILKKENEVLLDEHDKLENYLEILKKENEVLLEEHKSFNENVNVLTAEKASHLKAHQELEECNQIFQDEIESWKNAHDKLADHTRNLTEEFDKKKIIDQTQIQELISHRDHIKDELLNIQSTWQFKIYNKLKRRLFELK
ncbi:hypothetical protein MJH12_06420, partial [bacterium]|nr:hypothetical protein [bacterium]